MKQKQQTTSKKTLKSANPEDIQELQKVWKKTAQKLKDSSNQEDQMLYNFLEANHVDPHTCLITNKKKQESHSISCKAKDFRHSNHAR